MHSLIHAVSESHSVIHTSDSWTQISRQCCSSSTSLNHSLDSYMLNLSEYLRAATEFKGKVIAHRISYFSHALTEFRHQKWAWHYTYDYFTWSNIACLIKPIRMSKLFCRPRLYSRPYPVTFILDQYGPECPYNSISKFETGMLEQMLSLLAMIFRWAIKNR